MSALDQLLKAREQMGQLTGLRIDANTDFGANTVDLFLEREMFDDIEQALSCYEGDHTSLWDAIEEFRDQEDFDNGPLGVGA